MPMRADVLDFRNDSAEADLHHFLNVIRAFRKKGNILFCGHFLLDDRELI